MSVQIWQGGGSICVSSISIFYPLFILLPSQGLIYWVNLISIPLLLAVLFTIFNHEVYGHSDHHHHNHLSTLSVRTYYIYSLNIIIELKQQNLFSMYF